MVVCDRWLNGETAVGLDGGLINDVSWLTILRGDLVCSLVIGARIATLIRWLVC